jgi:hypothetical protein
MRYYRLLFVLILLQLLAEVVVRRLAVVVHLRSDSDVSESEY